MRRQSLQKLGARTCRFEAVVDLARAQQKAQPVGWGAKLTREAT
jgi:hypothetical protein